MTTSHRYTRTALLLAVTACGCGAAPGAKPQGRPSLQVDPSGEAAQNLHVRMEAFRHLADDDATTEVLADAKTVWRVPIAGAPSRGNPAALVTIVEFGDFQCGYCVRAEKVLAQIRTKYGDTVRFVWRDDPLPFHERAAAAAELAREARAQKGDEGFWAAHDALLSAGGDLSDAALDATARSLGLDAPRVAAAIAQNRYEEQIDDDLELADDVGAEGTPSFFINGRSVVGAQPFESFNAVIDDELSRVTAMVRSGTPASALYETLTQGGHAAPDPRKVSMSAPPTAAYRGDPAAPVVIQEFADFQCPYCVRAEGVVRRVLARYGSQVKLVWRDLPLPMHSYAEAAAEAAAEAKKQKGNAGFWAMHDKLLANDAGPRGLERPALARYAQEIGLDAAAFEKALDRRAHAAEVTIDAKAAAAVDIRGTPAFLVDGYELDGAQPYVRFRKWIKRALQRPGQGS